MSTGQSKAILLGLSYYETMALDAIRQTEVLIIGAGPAGLAVAASLQQRSIPFLLLEEADQVGVSWRRHYQRLHLHTDKRHSELPFFPYPKEYPRYPSRVQVVEYLEAYARHSTYNHTLAGG